MKKLEELFGIDVRTLALIRVLFAVILLFDIGIRMADLSAHYTDAGILPREALILQSPASWYVSIHMLSGIWQVQAFLFVIQIVFALMLLIGYRTRLATIISWLMLMSLHNRLPGVLQGGDAILRLSLFWGMFLPWGRTYSVDSALDPPPDYKKRILSLGTAGYLLQAAFVYIFTALLKTGDMWRTEGSAIYYILQIDQLTSGIGRFMLKFPHVLEFMTIATFNLEALGPFFLYIPVWTQYIRLIVVGAFAGMHAGIATTMKIGLFPFISITSILGYLPSVFWDTLILRLKTRERKALKIYYDTNCSFCRKAVHIIRAFFLIPETTVAPAEADPAILQELIQQNSWVVVDSKGKRHYAIGAVEIIMKHSPLLWPCAPIMQLSLIRTLGEYLYRWVARRRVAKCVPELITPRSRFFSGPYFTVLSSTAAAFFIAYIFMWNVGTLYPDSGVPRDRQWIGLLLRLDQRWDMFSPYPLLEDGWFVMPGNLSDGSSVDIFRNGASVNWDKPHAVADTYKNHRWRKFFLNFWLPYYDNYRVYYNSYVCREWNRTHSEDKQLIQFQIVFMLERTQPNYQPSTPEPNILSDHYCRR